MPVSGWRRWVGPAVLIAGLSIILTVVQSGGSFYWRGLFVNLGVFLILVLSLNLSTGFTGVFSLGHIGFMALGAYGSAILAMPVAAKAVHLPDLPPWLAQLAFDWVIGPIPLGFLLASVLIAFLVAGLAGLVGLVLMRLNGNFVSVATLGFLVIVRVILVNADAYTRGSRTFSGVIQSTNLIWVWLVVALTVYVVWRLKRSAFGRAMLAQREDSQAAQAIGIDVIAPRLLAFMVSAFFTALAGALYAHWLTSFSPAQFYFDLTFRVVTMLVVGGLGSVSGSILGATLIVMLEDQLRRVADATQLYGISQIILAALFLAIMIFRREGLLGGREIQLTRLFSRRGQPLVE